MRRVLVLSAAVLALAALPARADAVTLTLRCDGGGGAIPAMENSYIVEFLGGPCWGHVGHHTYDLGGVYELSRLTGSVFTVEVQLSPPAELDPEVIVPIVVESSTNGRDWTVVHRMPYQLALERQGITFDTLGIGVIARYLRVRQPMSAAQGLSGYLDSSSMTVTAEPATLPPTQAPPLSLRCAEHIMERFFTAHPCWYGGINRYDAPSFFHTYPIAPTDVVSITGSATLLPWRTDDYNGSGGSRTDVVGYVQVSTDARAWNTVGSFSGKYGLPIPFGFQTAARAAYVRLVPERHRAHPYSQGEAPLKHPRGFLVDSSIVVTPA